MCVGTANPDGLHTSLFIYITGHSNALGRTLVRCRQLHYAADG
jgi:hypothetical protein